MSQLFAATDLENGQGGGGVPLSALRAIYAIDRSGSTAGEVLRRQLMSAAMLMPYIAHAETIAWDGSASRISSLASIVSQGNTIPSCMIPFLREAQCLVLYTDGQIDMSEMERFQREMMLLKPMPIVVIFTMSSNYTLEGSTIAALHAQVNMSIPEACLKMSNDVCIVVNVEGVHKLLMAKGAFNVFGKLPTLLPETVLSQLQDFDMTLLKKESVRFRILPPGQINLNGFAEPLILEALYNATPADDVPFAVLEALCDRVYFPQFDMARIQAMLSRRLRALNENKEVETLRAQLAAVAVDAARAGGAEHRALLARLQEATQRRGKEVGADIVKLRSLLQRFLQMLAEYAIDRTSIALGSNRAVRAKQIDPTLFEEIVESDCVTIAECPIFLQSGPACVLLQLPTLPGSGGGAGVGGEEGKTVVEFCTSDNSMEGPFNFGRLLHKYGCVTRGIYCLEFARQARENPFTRAPIAGFIPLSKDPLVVMRFMSKLYGDSRELWHMLRGYIAMMTMHCLRDEWAARELIIPQLQALIDKYDCTFNLKGNTEDRRPLRGCLQYVTQNYGTCLRDRLPDDSRTILAVTDLLMPPPAHTYERAKVLAMLQVVDRFSRLLAQYKRDDCPSMLGYIIDVDEYEHFVSARTTVDSLIARIFWNDSRAAQPKYKFLKLQTAIETAMQDRTFGPLLSKAFSGVSYLGDDDAAEALRVALAEPSGSHFGEEKYGRWDAEGRPKTQCVYCGRQFSTSKDMYAHLRQEFGQHCYNGQRDVLRVIRALGVDAPEITLFLAAKQLLYKRYGEHCGALHTQRCKKMLLHFIRQFKQTMRPVPALSNLQTMAAELQTLVARSKRGFAEANAARVSLANANRFNCAVCRAAIYDDVRFSNRAENVDVCKSCAAGDKGKELIASKNLLRVINAW